MASENILVAITASREKGEIVYRVDCSSSLTNEEFEYYLEESRAYVNGNLAFARKTFEVSKELSAKRKR
jgi:hypothetical protein